VKAPGRGGRLAAPTALAAALLGATAPPAATPEPLTPPEYRRGVEQTFLTYPEWFLVHSPAEYAAFLEHGAPSDFPFLGHLRQFWHGYASVWRATRARRDRPNPGYHVMILTIGLSTTAEYGLKAAYELLFGRPAEILRGTRPTAEERFATTAAREYVEFIRVRPWYEFDFLGRLARLWRETGALGRDLPRKWERKLALTHEYVAKAGYAWLIGQATRAAYEAESTVTAVVLEGLPPGAQAGLPRLQVLAQLPDGLVLATVPRYAAFGEHALALARAGARFREIAGNRSVILVTALVPDPARLQGLPGELLFREPLLTQPGVQRLALVVPVERLHEALPALARPPARLEHVYDY
jgi:hypothetical protein